MNPCSRTAPCKTWAGAISKTAAGGIINALDPGGYGTLTITKSITVDGTTGAGFGHTLNSGGINGFNINDSATGTPNTIKVVLRNVHIDGAGTTLGLNGVRFTSGKELTLENVTIQNQSGRGVDVQSTAGVTKLVNLINTTIVNVGAAAVAANISAGNPVKVTISNSRLLNSASGLFAGDDVEALVADTLISHNTAVGIDAAFNSVVNVDDCKIMNNSIGVQTASTATIRLGRSSILQNATRAFGVSGGPIQTYGDNYFSGNGAGNIGVLTSIASSKQ